MSFAMTNEIRSIQKNVLELLKRIEALEDLNVELRRKMPTRQILTLPKEKADTNVQGR
jgi:hypothetical protein